MRRSLQILAAAACLAGLASRPAAADLRLDELVGHWKFDASGGGTALDSINSNNGAWQNGDQTNLTWTTGQIGRAASLVDAGGNDFFRIPAIPELENGAGWTISAWINPEAQTDGYNGIFMSRTTNGGGSWGLALEGGGPFHTDNRMNVGGGLDSPDLITVDGGWFHVASTWDAATGIRHAYVNGDLVASSPDDGADGNIGPITASGVWDIGYDDCCSGRRDFDGQIDDLALWKAPLDAAGIAEVYSNGLAGKDVTGTEPPLILEGDVNGDLLVNDADFEILRGAFYQSVVTRGEGDLTGDGFVDFDDFNEWKVAANSAAPAAQSLPEPTSCTLWLVAAAGGLLTPTRRRR